ncbi:hypothetical protein EWM14_09380 [Clostridioides difficile]|nr:hypothetical protein EWM14_09380 [Clostridioides difficile]
MSNETNSSNFIKNIIINDLETGKHDSIITRFPPEPNGYLHIGHAKSICLNFGLAKEFNGKANLRFDDTNPLKEDVEYVESIKEDVKWLGFDWNELNFASNYFDEMYKRALILIKKGKAYVCDLTQEEMREYRGTLTEPGKESPHRNRTIEENLDLFERMKNGKIKVAGPYKVFGLVNSQYELELRPTLKDGNLVVSLENVKIGKFKLSDKMLEKILSNYNKKVPFEVNGNKITLEKSYLYPITLKNISIKKGNVDLDMEVEIDLKSQINGALGYLKDSGKVQDILNHLINLKKTSVG